MAFSETTIQIAKLQLAGFTAVEIAKKLHIAKTKVSDTLWRIRGRELQVSGTQNGAYSSLIDAREKRRMEIRLIDFGETMEKALRRLSKVHNLETDLELLGYRGGNGDGEIELHLYTVLGSIFDEHEIPKPSQRFSIEKLLGTDTPFPGNPVTPHIGFFEGETVMAPIVDYGETKSHKVCGEKLGTVVYAGATFVVVDLGNRRDSFGYHEIHAV